MFGYVGFSQVVDWRKKNSAKEIKGFNFRPSLIFSHLPCNIDCNISLPQQHRRLTAQVRIERLQMR